MTACSWENMVFDSLFRLQWLSQFSSSMWRFATAELVGFEHVVHAHLTAHFSSENTYIHSTGIMYVQIGDRVATPYR